MKRLIAFLKSRPIDYELYRRTNPVGLTRVAYSLPWWAIYTLMLALGGLAWWSGR